MADAFSAAFGGGDSAPKAPPPGPDAFSAAFGGGGETQPKSGDNGRMLKSGSMLPSWLHLPGLNTPQPTDPANDMPSLAPNLPPQSEAERTSYVPPSLSRIGSTAAQAYEDTPPLLTPRGQQLVDQMGVLGPTIYNPLLHILGGVPAAYNALGAGVGEGVGELLDQPGLGRDIYMASQFLPALLGLSSLQTGGMGGMRPGGGRTTAPEASSAPPVTLDALTQAVRNADQGTPTNPVPVGGPNPLRALPPAANELTAPESGLRSVGAASRDQSQAIPDLTPAQQQAGLSKSVAQTAAERAGPQGVDHQPYVPGVMRPLAAREFSPANSVAEKTFADTDPVFRANLGAIEKHNQETMKDYFQSPEVTTPQGDVVPGVGAGDAIALEKLREARDKVTPPSLKIFDQEQPVDASDVVAKIDEILAGPEGKRNAVISVLNDARAKLFDKKGNRETLPSQLYGARQNITDMLRGKGLTKEQSDAQLAKGQLEDVLDVLDPTIAQGAPKFADYIGPNGLYAQASAPITAMRFLQSYGLDTGKLTNAAGDLDFLKVQKLYQTVAKQRAEPGVQPAKALTEAQVQAIEALRNELAATHYKDQLARVKGSDTTQKLSLLSRIAASPLAQAAAVPAEAGAHMLMAAPTMGIGNALLFAGRVGQRYYTAAQAKKAAAAEAALKSRLLETTPPPETP